MNLTYYLNKSDRRYVNKTLQQISLQDHANPVTVELLEDTSIVNPTFKMRDVDLYMTSNYVYIDDLRRYYFIDDVRLSHGYAYLMCSVDVLESWKADLLDSGVILKRQQKIYDADQNDGELPIEQYPAKRCIGHFDSPFLMSRNTYVMGVVGNTSGGGE